MRHVFASNVLCLGLLSCSLGACAQPGVRAWVQGGNFELDGGLNTSDGSGANLDSLGLGGGETAFSAGVELDWDPLHVALESLNTELDGQGVIDGALDFDDSNIALGETVNSELDAELAQVRMVWNVLPSSFVDLGLGIGLANFDYSAMVDSLSGPGGLSLRDEQRFAFLTARARKEIGRVELLGHASGLSYELGDESVDYFDLSGTISVRLLHIGPAALRLDLGYRHLELEVGLDANVEVDGSWSGPFAGVSLRL